MANPYMQFWVNEWLGCLEVRACTPAARALWMDMLCFMQNSPKRGYLMFESGDSITTEELARMTGFPLEEATNHIAEMRRKSVFSETPDGVIYCRRMVREAKLSETRSRAAKAGWRQDDEPLPEQAKPDAKVDAKRNANGHANGNAKTMQNPGNPFPSPIPSPDSSSIDEWKQVRKWLQDYVQAFGIVAGVPDESICRRVIAACNGKPLDDLQTFLIGKCKAGQRPSKSWAWFVTVVENEYAC